MKGITSTRLKAAGLVLGSIVMASVGYGFVNVTSQVLPLWTKDVNGEVQLAFRTSRTGVSAFSQGGTVLSTTTTETSDSFGTLTEAQMLANSLLSFSADSLAATTTLPATSTMTTLLPTAGDFRTWILQNATTSLTNTNAVGFAAGTGIDLQAKSLNAASLTGTTTAALTCIRKASTDVTCIFDPFVDADDSSDF